MLFGCLYLLFLVFCAFVLSFLTTYWTAYFRAKGRKKAGSRFFK